MVKIFKLLICLTAVNAFGQVNPQEIASTIEANQNHNKIDSVAKALNYKGGDRIRILTQFSVGEDGSLTDIIARAPHPVFEEEAIRLLKAIPKIDLPKNKIQSQRFSLPIIFVIETEKEKKRRLKKENKAREKMGKDS